MTTIYDIIEKVKTNLRNNPIVNTVTFGDISQVDLNKTTMFPLSHFLLGEAQMTEHTIRLTLNFLFIDVVDYSKDFNSNDFGDRQDDTNLVDVYNTQLQIANELISEFRRGDLYREGFQIVGEPICEPFKDRFEIAQIEIPGDLLANAEKVYILKHNDRIRLNSEKGDLLRSPQTSQSKKRLREINKILEDGYEIKP